MNLDKYLLKEKLGQGGMGEVWLGFDPDLDMPVAVKTLPKHLAEQDSAYVERFFKEARTAVLITHPNLVRVFAAGSDADIHYIVMEYVDGQTIRDLIQNDGRLDPDDAVSIIIPVVESLIAAGKYNVIHRDIKPDNIMLDNERTVKLCDMGLAKQLGEEEGGMTMTGATFGTPAYIAPEQALDAKAADARSDIYSLGATFYHMVTGALPFPGTTAMKMMMGHMRADLPHPSVHVPDLPDNICSVICKMMAKNPDDRYQAYSELLQDLNAILAKDSPANALQSHAFATKRPSANPTQRQKRARSQVNSEVRGRSGGDAKPLGPFRIIAILSIVVAGALIFLASRQQQEEGAVKPKIIERPAALAAPPQLATRTEQATAPETPASTPNSIPVSEALPSKPVAAQAVQEGPGVFTWNGHRYGVLGGTHTWSNGRKICQKNGGHVLTLESEGEVEALASVVGGKKTWLGATDEKGEAAWKWVTGEPLDFTRWSKGNPNQSDGRYDYAYFSGGAWQACPPHWTMQVICEWDSLKEPVAEVAFRFDSKILQGAKFAQIIGMPQREPVGFTAGMPPELRPFYWSARRPRQGRLDIRVLSDGLVLALVDTENWGDPKLPGSWREEIQNREEIGQLGWQEVGEFIDGKWLALARKWKAGDRFYLRTRRDSMPRVLLPTDSGPWGRFDSEILKDVKFAQIEGMAPLELIGDTPGVPKDLQSFHWSKAVAYQGRLDVRVLSDGLVLAMTNMENWGDPDHSGGDWRKELQRREQFKGWGWREVGELMDGKWLVLAKEWKAGERFYLRTRKYATPKVILPTPNE